MGRCCWKGREMLYGTVEGIAERISRLIMGAPKQEDPGAARAVFDTFHERGGNCFDTAFIYQEGKAERFLGRWIADREVRRSVIILGKGAHTPNCDPLSLHRELSESLERLGTEYVDLYMLHRDNLEVPIGEFVEALNEEREKGRVRAVGASNWTKERFDAANAYADKHGLARLVALSNHFSLAEMGEPTFEGCLDCMDTAWVEWLVRRRVPNFAWSSQAGGLFVEERAVPERGQWAVAENLGRKARSGVGREAGRRG